MSLVRDTTVAVLDSYFEQYAMGNRGYAEVEKCDIDGLKVDFKVKIRHRQKILGGYIEATNYVEGVFDLEHPDDIDSVYEFQLPDPLPDIRIGIRDLVTLLVSLI